MQYFFWLFLKDRKWNASVSHALWVPLAWAFARTSANPGGAAAVTGGNGSCTQIEELWLEAQSVPSTSRIPCIQTFPAGAVGALAVRDGESVLELSRASVDININAAEPQAAAEAGSVTIRLTPTCVVPTTGDGQIVAPGVRRFRTQGPAGTPQVVDVFPGACLSYQPEPGIGPSAGLLDQAQRAVAFRTRDELREALRRRSGGRLQLDPEAGN